MPIKMIQGDTAWKAGASWDTGPPINTGSQVVIEMLNLSPSALYTGDVVVTGAPTAPDPTAVGASTTTTAQSPYVIGVVGGQTNTPGTGGSLPNQLAPALNIIGTVGVSNPTVTATTPVPQASWVGLAVSGFQILPNSYIASVVVGTSFTMNQNSAPGTIQTGIPLLLGPRPGSVGPGYLSGVFPFGDLVPVVIAGVAYVNIGSSATAAGAQLSTSAGARIASTAGSTLGNGLGVTLEANTAGVPSADGTNTLVRSWITRS